jgi:4-hydroxy-tetrahydrodipicolinate reductase
LNTSGVQSHAPVSAAVAAIIQPSAETHRSGATTRGDTTEDFDAHIIETHHTRKKDAPSGTAIAIAKAASDALERPIPTTSIRAGSVPGTHELLFDGAFEQLSIVHEARDRRVFAEGALTAADWLVGKKGVFTMRDVLQLEKRGAG